MMTRERFALMQNHEKVNVLYDHGVYVGKRKVGKISVLLYQIDGFYAEIFYRIYRRKIERICCFSGTARLDPYLTEIDLEHLV